MRSVSCDDEVLVREFAKLKVIDPYTLLIRVAVMILYTLIEEEEG